MLLRYYLNTRRFIVSYLFTIVYISEMSLKQKKIKRKNYEIIIINIIDTPSSVSTNTVLIRQNEFKNETFTNETVKSSRDRGS